QQEKCGPAASKPSPRNSRPPPRAAPQGLSSTPGSWDEADKLKTRQTGGGKPQPNWPAQAARWGCGSRTSPPETPAPAATLRRSAKLSKRHANKPDGGSEHAWTHAMRGRQAGPPTTL